MSSSRAEKSGFAAEARQKILSKYDEQLASEILAWMSEVSAQTLPTDGAVDSFLSTLKSGVVLCNLANALKPGAVAKVNKPGMAFKEMENIGFFLGFVDSAGLFKTETFQTVSLFEGEDPNSVLICLSALAHKADKLFGKKALGPREAQKEQREWTDEQLRSATGSSGCRPEPTRAPPTCQTSATRATLFTASKQARLLLCASSLLCAFLMKNGEFCHNRSLLVLLFVWGTLVGCRERPTKIATLV